MASPFIASPDVGEAESVGVVEGVVEQDASPTMRSRIEIEEIRVRFTIVMGVKTRVFVSMPISLKSRSKSPLNQS